MVGASGRLRNGRQGDSSALSAYMSHPRNCRSRPAWKSVGAWPDRTGYATEAAQAAVAFGFEQLYLEELVAFTAIANLESRAVMERLGMRLDSEFDHPQVPIESVLHRHVLYRLRSPE